MRASVSRCLVALSLVLGAAACGELPEGEGEEIELSSLEGLDVPADYAGGRYVKVKGALTKGRTKRGVMADNETYHGYTLAGARGETLRLRGLGPGMTLLALYGPQKADGTWGAQLIKRWGYRPMERNVPIVEYKATKAGKYLVVFSMPARGDRTDYALTACNGECVAKACLEWKRGDENLTLIGFVSRTEAEVAGGVPTINDPAFSIEVASGSCGERPRTCAASRRPVCARIIGTRVDTTFPNFCQAKVATYDAMGDALGIKSLYAHPGACQD